MTGPSVANILDSLNREVLTQLDLAASIAHPGETGRARENVIAAYLRRIVPKDFGVDTGFVFDARGGISRQVDIVIHRVGYHPVFEIGGVKHFIIESVAAVLEIKASIAKRERLQSALENICSVKALDRTNAGSNYVVVGGQQGTQVDATAFNHQVFGAIVTEASLSNETLRDELCTFLRDNPDRRLWPNIYADVRGVIASHCKSIVDYGQALTVIPVEANGIYITDTSKPGPPALVQLTYELINFLRVAPLIDYKPSAYLGPGVGSVHRWAL